MKTFLFLLSFVTSFAFGSNDEKPIIPKVKEVTVFLHGAEITTQGSTRLAAGYTEVVLTGVSPNIVQNSIQVKGAGEMIILGVNYRVNHLSQMPRPKAFLELEDSLESLQHKQAIIDAQKAVLTQEEQLLMANKSIGGQDNGVTGAELEKVANLLRTRLTEIKMKQIDLQLKEKDIQQSSRRITGQINELNALRNRNTGEIVVQVESRNGGNAQFTASYLVNDAGWSPVYDLRADQVNKPVNLVYRANVYQTTGEDWENVSIKLSTGNPTQSAVQPTLVPWWLSFQEYYKQLSGKEYSTRSAPAAAKSEALDEAYSQKVDLPSAESLATYTTVKEGQTQIEYIIAIPYTIKSGSKPRLVEIQKYELPASYTYYAAPKIDNDAFLLAKISGWDKFNLLPGEAIVYFDGTYIGKSYINTNTTQDTLTVSLGRDKNVSVSRNLVKDLSDRKDIVGGKKVAMVYEISVRNKKSTGIEMIIQDQVPITRQSDINITTDETSGATLNEETGLLTWRFTAKPGETKKMRFGFTVKYPKDKVIQGL